MTSHSHPSADELSTRLFLIVIGGTAAFFAAMGVVFFFMKA